MSTAQKVVDRALSILTLNSELIPASPYHQAQCFDVLVFELSQLSGNGFQWVKNTAMIIPNAITDDIREPVDAFLPLAYITARTYADSANIAWTREATYKRLKDSLSIKYYRLSAQSMPNTLPVGAGNTNYTGQVFFRDQTEAPEETTNLLAYSYIVVGASGIKKGFSSDLADPFGSIVIQSGNSIPAGDNVYFLQINGSFMQLSLVGTLAADTFTVFTLFDESQNVIGTFLSAQADSSQIAGNTIWQWQLGTVDFASGATVQFTIL